MKILHWSEISRSICLTILLPICLLSATTWLPSMTFAQSGSIQSETVSNWNQWRGPERNGEFSGETLPDAINESTLKSKWRIELGPSYSGPMVVNDMVIVTETRNESHEVVRALDRESGKEIWNVEWQGAMKVPFFARDNGSWIRSTPAFDNGKLYVAGILDVFVCLDIEDGSEIWRVDFPGQTGSAKPDFGCASSPLVVEDGMYIQAGGAFYKLNKDSGEVIWKTLADGGGMMGSAFSSPVLATLHGKQQLLVQGREELHGVDPTDGSVLWTQKVPSFRGMNILTPVVFNDGIFTSSYRNKSWLFNINHNNDQWSVSKVWETPKAAYMSTPVAKDGFVYLHLGNQRFTCMELSTGEVKWTSETFGKYSSMIIQDDKIVALDQRGELIMFRASPEKFELLSQHRVSDQVTWAHLAASENEFFVRELNAISAFEFEAKE